jgi:hypothetical protein
MLWEQMLHIPFDGLVWSMGVSASNTFYWFILQT